MIEPHVRSWRGIRGKMRVGRVDADANPNVMREFASWDPDPDPVQGRAARVAPDGLYAQELIVSKLEAHLVIDLSRPPGDRRCIDDLSHNPFCLCDTLTSLDKWTSVFSSISVH
jgi:hypothetical protein